MALQDTLGPVFDQELQAIWEQFEAGERQGIIKGKIKGKIEGEIYGQRKTLKRLLAQRFGVLSTRAIARINKASAKDLEAMELRVLTAPTLDEVLGKPIHRAR